MQGEEKVIAENTSEEGQNNISEEEEEEGNEVGDNINEDESKISVPKKKLKNYYKIIADHKEIVRNVMSLQGAMLLLKPDVIKCTEVSFFPLFTTKKTQNLVKVFELKSTLEFILNSKNNFFRAI